MSTLSTVTQCTVSACAFNDKGCHAQAITIGEGGSLCGTFIALDTKGGSADQATVGTCVRTECRHNADLECTADSITVAVGEDGRAACQTFAA